ncbi:ABC1-domain-containing protein [Gonapodya prolifera JEL478]|uniref:ABC1-domain-containing protein n=1 Tax=Gonapodya prolifera (strain JEL478) TaxID=1344416 RepID=A0A139AZD4_GONPJ|nr:ABC1-domain-containing protein [Gonapodya prolifera JEL478]|eukprot:KXS22091.1 ABC1-domain-containing protein [Gonapodya prolifera JEL478]
MDPASKDIFQTSSSPEPSVSISHKPVHGERFWSRSSIVSSLRTLSLIIPRPIQIFFRLVTLVFRFLPALLSIPALFFGELVEDDASQRAGALWWYGVLVECMERAGPTFIKLAQWASTREDLLPPALTTALSRLQADARPHSWEDTRRAVREAFGMDVEDMFESLERTPWGVGAIAQVHRGVLNPLHTPPSFSPTDPPYCAVKILHPDVAVTISLDLAIIHGVARLAGWLIPGVKWLALEDEVDTFGKMMKAQLDLRAEATNVDEFRKRWEGDLGRRSRRDVCFPIVVRPYVSEKVLVETFEVAIPFTQFISGPRTPADPLLARIGLDTLLTMLAVDNFVHVDMHPGNMLVTFRPPSIMNESLLARALHAIEDLLPGSPTKTVTTPESSKSSEITDGHDRLLIADPSEWPEIVGDMCRDGYRPHLVLLDCGLVSKLSAKDLRNFLDLFTAVVSGRGEEAGRLMVERSRNPDSCIDRVGFSRAIATILADARERTLALKDIGVGDILTRVFQVVRKYRVQFEGEFVNTVVSIVLVEGIGRRLDPDLDLLAFAAKYLGKIEDTIREAGGELATKDKVDLQKTIALTKIGSIYRQAAKATRANEKEVSGDVLDK